MKVKFFVTFVLLFALFGCNREYYVDDPEGTWQMSDAKITARTPLGETLEATTMKELARGVIGIIKTYMPDEDYSEFETAIEEMEDTPFSFTENRTFRFRFFKDGTYTSYTKNDKGEWEQSDTKGEYSYAGYRLTLYNTREDGTNTTIPCMVLRLTNKNLVLQMKVADILDLPGGNPLMGADSDDEDADAGETLAMILTLLNYIDLSTELSFSNVR